MLYFAYGSNMSLKRMKARVPSTQRIAVATLPEHRLAFHKKGKDGSAKCDAEYTGNPGDYMLGVIYQLPGSEKTFLDQAEGLGRGYDQKRIIVQTVYNEWVETMTYYALLTDPQLKPFHWYKEHVLIGARENGLPYEYVQQIESVESIDDDLIFRKKNELSIYL